MDNNVYYILNEGVCLREFFLGFVMKEREQTFKDQFTNRPASHKLQQMHKCPLIPVPLHILSKPQFPKWYTWQVYLVAHYPKKKMTSYGCQSQAWTPNTELQLHISNTVSSYDQNPDIIIMHIKELTLVIDICTTKILSHHTHTPAVITGKPAFVCLFGVFYWCHIHVTRKPLTHCYYIKGPQLSWMFAV